MKPKAFGGKEHCRPGLKRAVVSAFAGVRGWALSGGGRLVVLIEVLRVEQQPSEQLRQVVQDLWKISSG